MPGDPALFLVQHQNKELAFDLQVKKRSIADLRGRLRREKQQSAAAEELLSVLDRSFAQVKEQYSLLPVILYFLLACLNLNYSLLSV